MSKKTDTETTSKPATSPTNRVRKPLIMTKRAQGTQRAVKDTKDRQDALQKEHTKAFNAAQPDAQPEAKSAKKPDK